MDRLTVNKPVSEMGMVELAHNCCYIAEDGSASYRDFTQDVDIRDFARELLCIYDDEDYSKEETAFDEEMMEELKYDARNYASTLIALLYRNMWAMAELREQLKLYEDAEEQGLLLRLPVSEGTPVFTIIGISKVDEEEKEEDKKLYVREVPFVYEMMRGLGIFVFLTKEAADQKLTELRGGNGKS